MLIGNILTFNIAKFGAKVSSDNTRSSLPTWLFMLGALSVTASLVLSSNSKQDILTNLNMLPAPTREDFSNRKLPTVIRIKRRKKSYEA